jgi:hypothetical protein
MTSWASITEEVESKERVLSWKRLKDVSLELIHLYQNRVLWKLSPAERRFLEAVYHPSVQFYKSQGVRRDYGYVMYRGSAAVGKKLSGFPDASARRFSLPELSVRKQEVQLLKKREETIHEKKDLEKERGDSEGTGETTGSCSWVESLSFPLHNMKENGGHGRGQLLLYNTLFQEQHTVPPSSHPKTVPPSSQSKTVPPSSQSKTGNEQKTVPETINAFHAMPSAKKKT